MAIYIDPLFYAPRRNAEGWDWCHMRADSIVELHEFAAKIGRKRCWFHRGDHYDLTPSFRLKAVEAGAIELTPLDFSTLVIREKRKANRIRPTLGHVYRHRVSGLCVEAVDTGYEVRMWDPATGAFLGKCKPFEFDRDYEWLSSKARYDRKLSEAS